MSAYTGSHISAVTASVRSWIGHGVVKSLFYGLPGDRDRHGKRDFPDFAERRQQVGARTVFSRRQAGDRARGSENMPSDIRRACTAIAPRPTPG